MTQEPRKLINLAVHESSDPSVISHNSESENSRDINDLNDSVHDHENVDVPTPEGADVPEEEHLVHKQMTIANLSAG